jgi:protocatechuate 3,4-dioxygenase beta subunit
VSPAEPVSTEVAEMLEVGPVRRVWAEQDEGPYHRDAQPFRRDIVEGRPGMPLQLGMRVERDGVPFSGVAAKIWHCDALGRYSGFPPPDPSVVVTAATAPKAEYLPDETFLRGRQITDAAGLAEFHTIYPGWYPGRTVHIHVIVHSVQATFTTQLYFPDSLSDQVLATAAPYAERPRRDTTNDTDTIFPPGGVPAVLDIASSHDGYRAAACLVIVGSPADMDGAGDLPKLS